MVGLVLRYAPMYRDLRAAQAEGRLGQIVSIEAAEHIEPYHGAFFMRDWRRYESYSGSFMLEKCCHDLDLYNSASSARGRSGWRASAGARPSCRRTTRAREGVNDLELFHRKPSGLDRLGPGVRQRRRHHRLSGRDRRICQRRGDELPHQPERARPVPPLRHHRHARPGRGRLHPGCLRRDRRADRGKKVIHKKYAATELSQHYGADETDGGGDHRPRDAAAGRCRSRRSTRSRPASSRSSMDEARASAAGRRPAARSGIASTTRSRAKAA